MSHPLTLRLRYHPGNKSRTIKTLFIQTPFIPTRIAQISRTSHLSNNPAPFGSAKVREFFFIANLFSMFFLTPHSPIQYHQKTPKKNSMNNRIILKRDAKV